MSCYHRLVDCKFLANASVEISRAKRLLINDLTMLGNPNMHSFNDAHNKRTYYEVGNTLGFFQELYEIDLKKNRIYYLQYEPFLMVASNSKKLIDSAIIASNKVNGDIPLYRHVHVINKMRIHTVLYNTNFIVPPITLN